MDVVSASRACSHCNESKRKCDRAIPTCQLCRKKKLNCVYPSRRPLRFVPIETEPTTPLPSQIANDLLDFESMSNELALSEILPHISGYDLVNANPLGIATIKCRGAWFMDPETLVIDHTPMSVPPDFQVEDLNPFMQLFQDWIADWVKTGGNLFLHPKLYRNKLPPCLQLAFTTVSAYLNRTPATTGMILSIVNDQASALTSLLDIEAGVFSPLLSDVARIHALLAYQIIGLFDGDIRSRHLAEKRTSYLTTFANSTLEKARTFGIEQTMFDTTDQALTHSSTAIASSDESLWRSWILLESFRRTFLVSYAVKAGYNALKHGWVECHGDLMFTHREGLWSASSSSEWADICASGDTHLLGRFNAERLFKIPNQDVDEFGKLMAGLTYGKERYSQWVKCT